MTLDYILGLLPEPTAWERDIGARVRSTIPWSDFWPLALWEIQSNLATFAMLGLVAFAPLTIALPIMLAWSLAATVIYFHARRHGFPDLLDTPKVAKETSRFSLEWMAASVYSLVKAWFIGFQPFVYSRTVCRVFNNPRPGRMHGTMRGAVVGVGMTLFGVASTQHLLRKAGYGDKRVLQLSVVGSCLNVPYRLLLSAVVVNAVAGVVGAMGLPAVA